MIDASRWVVGRAARQLGLPRSTAYDLIRRSDRVRKAGDLSAEELTAAWEKCAGDLVAMVAKLEVSKRGIQLRMTELGLP